MQRDHLKVSAGGLRKLLSCCLFGCALAVGFVSTVLPSVATAAGSARSRPPNVVLILADDAGVETIGAYGGQYNTPRIDALARQGARFENAHATPLCTPSRVRLLTGRYSFRNYKAFGHLDPKQPTIAKLLKRAGYRTAVSGKWQLAGNPLDGVPGATPRDAGFDEWRIWHAGPRQWDEGCQHWGPTLDTNGRRETYPGEFGSDLVQRFALDFIERNAKQPFFLFYSMILPHDPWVATPARKNASDRQEKFTAMMEYLDSQVGGVLDRLDALDIATHTLVVFLADNGTHPMIVSTRDGVKVQGGKGSTLDAGTHVPLIMRWAPRLPASTVSAQIVDLTDVFATVVSAAGQTRAARASDGYDLLPVLVGRGAPQRENIFMDFSSNWWPLDPARYAFTPQWKLYGDGRYYDTRSDPLESHPLIPEQMSDQARAARLRLQKTLDGMGDHAMTATDRHFPAGFDPKAVDFAAATARLADSNRRCGDPSRVP